MNQSSRPSICFVCLQVYGFVDPTIYSDTKGGGSERQIHLISKKLTREFDVSVIVGDYGQDDVEIKNNITYFKAYRPSKKSGITKFIGDFYRLFRSMKRADSELYIYRGNPRKAVIIFVISKLLRTEWVYNVASDYDLTEHYERENKLYRFLFNIGIKHSRQVIVQNERQKSILQTKFDSSSIIVPNGYPVIQEDEFTPRYQYFLWVGRIQEQQKQPHKLLEIANQCPLQKFKLVGPVVDEKYGSRLITEIEKFDNIFYEGTIPPDVIHQEYQRCQGLISTSRYEGFPNAFLEAWRHGKPVLSLDVDPNRFLADEANYFAEGSTSKLAEFVNQISCKPQKYRQESTERIIDKFSSNYGIDRVAEKYVNALDSAEY